MRRRLTRRSKEAVNSNQQPMSFTTELVRLLQRQAELHERPVQLVAWTDVRVKLTKEGNANKMSVI